MVSTRKCLQFDPFDIMSVHRMWSLEWIVWSAIVVADWTMLVLCRELPVLGYSVQGLASIQMIPWGSLMLRVMRVFHRSRTGVFYTRVRFMSLMLF